jgi:hypothetical protein
MAASATQNPPVQTDSKSAKKKKAKVTSAAESEVAVSVPEVTPSNGAPESSSGDGTYESPYIKELYKYDPTVSATTRPFSISTQC